MSATKANASEVGLQPVAAGDFEALVAVRIAAMRASLEQAGRFDPERARERLRQNYAPEHTQWILLGGQQAGFCTLRPTGSELHLDHLYVLPEFQNRGVGAEVLRRLLAAADRQDQPVHLGALKGSGSNRFYQRHGFVPAGEGEWDIYYVRAANPAVRSSS